MVEWNNKISSEEESVTSILIEKILDARKGHASVCIFAPVGDKAQLNTFLKQVERLGLDKREVDFLFIYRDIADIQDTGLSALYFVEKYPRGTSGCFIASQKLLYELGYSVIVSTDLDAELDCIETFDSIVASAQMRKVAVFTRSIFNENTSKQLAYNVNDWAAFPREFFEEVGFSTPYMWRGGEEYELLTRILKTHRDKFMVHSGGYTHPFVGFSIYHKLVERKKYHPYVSGILRAILFVSEYNKTALAKFVLWYVFYGFFADLLNDKALKRVLTTSGRFELLRTVDDAPNWFKIEKVKETGEFSNTSIARVVYLPFSLLSLAFFGRYDLYTDRITLLAGRASLLFGLVKATLLAPIRACQAIVRIKEWKEEKAKVIFPPTPINADEVEKLYKHLVCHSRL
jgi:hypothetical protein